MSRAIRLTRLHALNWYGYSDSIAVGGNLLLAGVTGSGKSILMDLVQFVIVGDLRLVKFNQSATGAHSDRSLKGYCLGDTKQEEGGVTQYMRDSAITYVAMEFTWPNRKRHETWGFRIEFSGAAETQGRVTPFFVPAALERSDFLEVGLDGKKRPLDYTAFKAMVESHSDQDGTRGRLYAELSEYLTHMAQPAHLNFDRSVLRGLLPTAMSFTFLRSFNEFCRQFILSADRLDVKDVSDSYRTFLRYEKDLTELNDQFTRLRAIADLFLQHSEARRDAVLARYLESELRHQHTANLLRDDEEKLAGLKSAWAEEESRLAELEKLIPERSAELDALKNAIRETPGGALYLEIKNRNQRLVTEIERLKETGRSLESALAARVRGAREWAKQLAQLPLDLDVHTLESLDRAIAAMESGGVAQFGKTFRSLGEIAQRASAEAARVAQPTQRRLSEIRHQLGELREQIAALSVGKLPFPTRLLDALNRSLLTAGVDLPARHLRELCELKDGEERWRPAIEVAFTRKFAVAVSAEHYDAAEEIYHQLREEARGESLVNPAKALKLRKPVKPGSLAEKLVTKHPVAEALISHLFGELICVDTREQLREHDAAITPDGFMTRGAFIERPRHYDNLPFVGQRGLRQQLAWKEQQRDTLMAEERQLRPLAEDVDQVQVRTRDLFEAPPSLYEDLARAAELPRLQTELDENLVRLNQIDRALFDDLSQRQSDLEGELAILREEQRRLDRSEKRAKFRELERGIEDRREAEQEARVRFNRVQNENDVSRWLRRMEELRTEMLGRYPRPDAAANRFAELYHEKDKASVEHWQQLVAARHELAMVHAKFDDLPTDSPENTAYERQLTKLEESEIPDYHAKAERERKTWEKLFRTQILEKLRNALFEVENTRMLLNSYLKRPIGNNRYRVMKWENPDFRLYHKLLDASALAREDELFFASSDAELREAIAQFLRILVEQPDSAEAAKLLDYRHYYDYDMEVDDLGEDGEVKATSRVDRQSGKFSGGENQSPYFIAILASYLRAYKRHDTRSKLPSLALVPIDEAFSKLSGERIKDCIKALESLDLQGVFSMSTGNIPYAFEHCDSLVVVAKEEKRVGKKVVIRNVPVSLHKDSPDARRLLGIDE